MTDSHRNLRLVEVDATNWRDVAAASPRPDQDRFVATTTYYLCLAQFGADWHSLAVAADGAIVGHVMWAVDETDGSVWLGGLVIDAAAQGRGIGRAAVAAFIEKFTEDGRVDIALSYLPDNTAARKLYADLGFVETGEMEAGEIVARLRRYSPQPRPRSRP